MKQLTIGNVSLANPVILAPMAGVSDLPFRLLCHEQGAGMVCSEMISAKAILYHNKNTEELMQIHPDEGPVSLQLFGSDPGIVSEMAKRIEERPFAVMDLNMGCPVPKVVNNGEGSALMKNPLLAGKIIEKTAKAIQKPLTVKIRKGFDDAHVNAVEMAKIAQESGAAAVAVHGRTREQYYSGTADWDIITQVKQAVKIPVIGNGDVVDAASALRLFEQTGCDGIMIARGALGNPYVFQEVKAAFAGVPYTSPSNAERLDLAIAHVRGLVAHKGPHGVIEMRKHIAYYVRGMKGASAFRTAASKMPRVDGIGVSSAGVYVDNRIMIASLFLKVSDEELPLLTSTTDCENGTAQLAQNGIRLIFVTLGANGVFYRFGEKTGHVAGVPCKVGDTNGAGDTFFGAALSKLCKEDLNSLTADKLESILAFANKAASITTSRHGAIPDMHTLTEVEG